mmetsp:Transcript_19419/g.42421  ORF Transcript_19419/g.42421 Transcript_19419/m.42421 type:complete len:222 (-) Transcript_19419:137-802(-)
MSSASAFAAGSALPVHAQESRRGLHEAGKLDPTARVLADIRKAQDGSGGPTYAHALSEIRHGRKQSHWIWYVWPTLPSLRHTSKPHFSLPDLGAAQAFLQDKVLVDRLAEITAAATEHLRKGVQPRVLFGSTVDATKFAETMTFFVVAAAELRDMMALEFCSQALDALSGGALEARTMAVVSLTWHHYSHVRTVSQLRAEVSAMTDPGSLRARPVTDMAAA